MIVVLSLRDGMYFFIALANLCHTEVKRHLTYVRFYLHTLSIPLLNCSKNQKTLRNVVIFLIIFMNDL